MEEIRIGAPEENQMPPEPAQLRADELENHVDNRSKKRKSKQGYYELKQPEKKKEVEVEAIDKVTPEQAKAEAMRPRIDRATLVREGKIARRTPRGVAKPL